MESSRATSIHKEPQKVMGGLHVRSTALHAFVEMTLIWFSLPADGYAILRVTDQQGNEVFTRSGAFAAGENHWVLRREAGIYTCHIETRFGAASRKVIMY